VISKVVASSHERQGGLVSPKQLTEEYFVMLTPECNLGLGDESFPLRLAISREMSRFEKTERKSNNGK